MLQEERFALLGRAVENSYHGFHIFGEGGVILYANDSALRMWGYDDLKQMKARLASDLCCDPEILKKIAQDIKNDGLSTIETQAKRRDNSIFDVLLSITHDQDSDGNDVYPVTSVDISKRKRIEHALEKRIIALTEPLEETGDIQFEDLFNLDEIQRLQDEFAEATGVASLISRPDGSPITEPSNFSRLCGEIIRKSGKGCANCEKSAVVVGRPNPDGPNIQTCLSGGLWDAGAAISVGGKHIASWLAGQVRDESQSEASIRCYAQEIDIDEDDAAEAFTETTAMSYEQLSKVARVLFTLANQLSTAAYQNVQQARLIGMQKKAEEELARYNDRLEELVDERTRELKKLTRAVEQSPVSVVITDRLGNMEYVNPTFTAITGYSSGEAIGENPRILKSNRQSPDFYNELWQTIQSGRKWTGNFINRKKNGDEFWESAAIAPLFDDNGEITHFVAVKEDISEQKRLEKEIIEAKNIAEKANRAKSSFLANMSHEIRTPMNAILGHAQILQRDNSLAGQQLKSIQSINKSGEHLLALINDILDMSKIEAGKIKLLPNTFRLATLLEEVRDLFRIRLEQKKLSFSMDIAADIPDLIFADENRIRQIVLNLVGNAIKFTERGNITLAVNSMGGTITIAVMDSGCGIPRNRLETVFGAFEQADEGMRTIGGTGLGLAISRQMARLMGGDVVVQSEYGKGSVFSFSFTYEIGDDRELAQKKVPRRVSKLKSTPENFRLLIVDDGEENRNVARLLLEPLGFSIREACDGLQALTLSKEWSPHIILMDVVMPVMDGLEATRRIKREPGGEAVSIIAVSASALDEERELVLENGADAFVKKPFRESELLEEIRLHSDVEYEYDEEREAATVQEFEPVSQADVERLPLELRQRMADAAILGKIDLIAAIIDEIKVIDQSIGHYLQGLADDFELEIIRDIFR